MFNPLVENLSKLTDQQLEQKITEITRKYAMLRGMHNYAMMNQVGVILEMHRQEFMNRIQRKQEEIEKQQNPSVNPFSSLDIN